jgi:MarR family transcriptional regulator, organic hydroperoxide resistance regulator
MDARRDPGGATFVPSIKAAPELGHVLTFMQLIWAVSHGLQAMSKRMERALGVSGPQRLVVRIIGEMPGVSAGTLASVLHVHPSTLTGVLRRLEDKGLVRRATARDDRRRAVLTLTAAGRRVNGLAQGTVEEAVSKVLASLPPATVASGRRLLAALAEALRGDPI